MKRNYKELKDEHTKLAKQVTRLKLKQDKLEDEMREESNKLAIQQNPESYKSILTNQGEVKKYIPSVEEFERRYPSADGIDSYYSRYYKIGWSEQEKKKKSTNLWSWEYWWG